MIVEEWHSEKNQRNSWRYRNRNRMNNRLIRSNVLTSWMLKNSGDLVVHNDGFTKRTVEQKIKKLFTHKSIVHQLSMLWFTKTLEVRLN